MATLTLESVDLEAERLLAVAETARRHFAELAKLLEASGPAFAPSHRLAMAVERARNREAARGGSAARNAAARAAHARAWHDPVNAVKAAPIAHPLTRGV